MASITHSISPSASQAPIVDVGGDSSISNIPEQNLGGTATTATGQKSVLVVEDNEDNRYSPLHFLNNLKLDDGTTIVASVAVIPFRVILSLWVETRFIASLRYRIYVMDDESIVRKGIMVLQPLKPHSVSDSTLF